MCVTRALVRPVDGRTPLIRTATGRTWRHHMVAGWTQRQVSAGERHDARPADHRTDEGACRAHGASEQPPGGRGVIYAILLRQTLIASKMPATVTFAPRTPGSMPLKARRSTAAHMHDNDKRECRRQHRHGSTGWDREQGERQRHLAEVIIVVSPLLSTSWTRPLH